MIQWGDFLIDPREGEDLCRMAVLLAMTVDQKMERDLILQLQKMGIKSAATTVAGFGISSQSNIIRSVVNLCLNTNIIERKREHVHPVAQKVDVLHLDAPFLKITFGFLCVKALAFAEDLNVQS